MTGEVWVLSQGARNNPKWNPRVQGVYDNEDAAVSDRERLGGARLGYSVEKWAVDSDHVAPEVTPDHRGEG